MADDVAAAKAELRTTMLARRDALPAEFRTIASERLADRGLPIPVGGRVVSAFWPIRSEIDPRPLLRSLRGSAAGFALPVIEAGALVFRAYAEGDELVTAPFGLRTPRGDAALVIPDVLLVPLAAFDRSGYRLGYGRGYYDAYLSGRRASGENPKTVGVGFALQEVPSVPIEAHDQRLDWVMTEAETIVLPNGAQR